MIIDLEVVDERKQSTESVLAERLAEARAAYPWLTSVTDEAFVEHVTRTSMPGSDAFSSLQAADVMLVLGSLARDPKCLRELDERIGQVVTSVLAKVGRSSDGSDLKQRVFERVLIGVEGGPPKILQYAGRAPLTSWLRLVAVRLQINLARRDHSDRHGSFDVEELACDFVAHDMELAMVRGTHADAFKKAFQRALSELEPRDRTILRLSVMEGSSIDEIGVIFRVHRATAARWLVQIRETLFERSRVHLTSHGDFGVTEFRELAGLLLSRLDVSLGRMLDDGTRAASTEEQEAREK